MGIDSTNRPTIFLIEEDDDARPLMKRNLVQEGYRVVLALDEEDALERVSDGHIRADLLLVNLVGRPVEEVLRIGRCIREHAQLDGATPLVILAEKYGADVEGTDVNVGGNDWIAYLEDAGQLRSLLGRLIAPKP
ncbi:MAG TPA: hypothetical protein VGX92_03780 [Pyrinomonadaceae bacterium]|jgi:DNA-binding response OmpR family regulator|nr:hypothetical protein [Pyrinomonadaceae bacterium]